MTLKLGNYIRAFLKKISMLPRFVHRVNLF